MKHVDRLNDEELKLIDTINRMSNQLNFADHQSSSSQHSQFLVEVIESLEDQLESIRRSLQVSVKA